MHYGIVCFIRQGLVNSLESASGMISHLQVCAQIQVQVCTGRQQHPFTTYLLLSYSGALLIMRIIHHLCRVSLCPVLTAHWELKSDTRQHDSSHSNFLLLTISSYSLLEDRIYGQHKKNRNQQS